MQYNIINAMQCNEMQCIVKKVKKYSNVNKRSKMRSTTHFDMNIIIAYVCMVVDKSLYLLVISLLK